MSPAGRPLELSLVRGARHYRASGRKVVLVKQHTPLVPGGEDGLLVHSSAGAPVDLIGGVDGRPWALEAKMTTGVSWPLEERRESQRAALRVLQLCDFTVGLVIEFTDQAEVYNIPWAAVEAFESAPWRRSLSLDWCRANGLLLPELDRKSETARKTLFLDGAAHPDCAGAAERVEAERRAGQVLTLEQREAAADRREERAAQRQRELRAASGVQRPHPSDKEAYQAYLRGVVEESIGRQLGAAAAKARLKRGRGR